MTRKQTYRMKKRLFGTIGSLLILANSQATVEVPAFTAYAAPDPNGGANRGKDGEITNWDAKTTLSWYGKITKKGELELSLKASAEIPKQAKLQLTVTPQSDPKKSVKLSGKAEGETVSFGGTSIAQPGYYKFTLEGKGT